MASHGGDSASTSVEIWNSNKLNRLSNNPISVTESKGDFCLLVCFCYPKCLGYSEIMSLHHLYLLWD